MTGEMRTSVDIDGLVMGRSTYEFIKPFDEWPYQGKPVHVLSTTLPVGADPRITVQRSFEDAVLRTIARLDGKPFPTTRGLVRGWVNGRMHRSTASETVFCAELVAATYTAMGLIPGDRPLNAYDPGSFWSGDDLELLRGARLGPEIPVDVPAS